MRKASPNYDGDALSREKEDENGESVNDKDDRAGPVESDNGLLDLRKLRPTDLSFNRRVFLPEPLDDKRKELKLQNLKNNLIQRTEEYVCESQSKNRTQSNNLS